MAESVAGQSDLEDRIDVAYLRLTTAKTPYDRRRAFAEMRELVAQRDAATVERMEREQGLA